MEFRFSTLLCIAMIALTACAGEPEQVKMDRRFLTGESLEQQLAELREAINGEVLDEHIGAKGEDQVFSMLTREYDDSGDFVGIFLRHYEVGNINSKLLWTYQDSISCVGSGAVAGAALVKNTSPELRPVAVLGNDQEQFVLRYILNCSPGTSNERVGRTLVVINALSGTPEVRLEAEEGVEKILARLDQVPAALLRDLWEERL
ncbi:hypothetical protein [Neolewinella persica]|uniref:hypothetical protein n=1 Tax=Neolewinella persica TaxID=70998 RepID=UPI00037A2EE8|nr:hypothetical protein [Neolewinella persica]